MFESLQMAPPDPILGLTEAFLKDSSPHKINLAVGVYKDAAGKTPILECVRRAEAALLEEETTKSYRPISGAPEYARDVLELLFGSGHEVLAPEPSRGRAVCAQTPGGTGALRVIANYLKQNAAGAKVWLSTPTWANHPNIFRHAGVETASYAYFDAARNQLDFPELLESLRAASPGDAVLLHGCCHNPTGVDPTESEWQTIAELLGERGLFPILDFAYQGFAEGLEEDAVGLRALAATGQEFAICSSFSKNFGLYCERVGALTLVARDAAEAQVALSHLKAGIRANYSNPPAHGGAIITRILGDSELRSRWRQELDAMRERIQRMRRLFVEGLREAGVERDFSFIERQCGMFSFSGLGKEQVRALRDEHSIYIVGSGRVNVAGMTQENLPRLCAAIAAVL